MCRRYSSGSNDILSLSQNMRADVWAERLDRHHLHAPPEKTFEQIRKRKETTEALAARLELDQQIDVAASGIAQNRPVMIA